MIKKTIEIEVDTTTWPRGVTVPPQLAGATGSSTLDLGSAFLMLGTLTMPDLLSPASPARFWAWLRYYLAPTVASDLRIAMDFAGLDPHQKGILSDDFGVALSTQWLFDRFDSLDLVALVSSLNDLPTRNDDDRWSLPMPATFVIEKGDRIRLAFVDPDYRKRLDPGAAIDVLRQLANRPAA
jgi:hypothetical protein